jgi:hypothetical protein
VTSRHERWARLWQPPRAHGEQPRERVVGPLELFYDLVVVVLVAQAAHHFARHLTWRGLGEFTVVFALVWIAWVNAGPQGICRRPASGRQSSRCTSDELPGPARLAEVPDPRTPRGVRHGLVYVPTRHRCPSSDTSRKVAG